MQSWKALFMLAGLLVSATFAEKASAQVEVKSQPHIHSISVPERCDFQKMLDRLNLEIEKFVTLDSYTWYSLRDNSLGTYSKIKLDGCKLHSARKDSTKYNDWHTETYQFLLANLGELRLHTGNTADGFEKILSVQVTVELELPSGTPEKTSEQLYQTLGPVVIEGVLNISSSGYAKHGGRDHFPDSPGNIKFLKLTVTPDVLNGQVLKKNKLDEDGPGNWNP